MNEVTTIVKHVPTSNVTKKPKSAFCIFKTLEPILPMSAFDHLRLRLRECTHVTKSARHRNSDQYFFVLENRISVRMSLQPIQPNKWTEIV